MKTTTSDSYSSSFRLQPFKFPSSTLFAKEVAKQTIFQYAKPNAKIRKFFTEQVEKITWSNKFSPETINLPARSRVEEFQVFSIALKTDTLKTDVLATIDKAIPSPIFFILTHEHKIQYIAAYKRTSEADTGKQVTSSYFASEWIDADGETTPLPVVIDLAALYHALIHRVLPLKCRIEEPITVLVDRSEKVLLIKREIERLNKRLQKEKQFNRQVLIKNDINQLTRDMLALTR